MGLACVNPPCINGKIDPWKNILVLDLLIQKHPDCVWKWDGAHALCWFTEMLWRGLGELSGGLSFILYFIFSIRSQILSTFLFWLFLWFYVVTISFTFCTQELAWLLLLWLSWCFRPFYISNVSCNSLMLRRVSMMYWLMTSWKYYNTVFTQDETTSLAVRNLNCWRTK